MNQQFVLQVAVRNEDELSVSLAPSLATVTVTVLDVNEAPVFVPATKLVEQPEDLAVGQVVATYTAQDPDKLMQQTVRYGSGAGLGALCSLSSMFTHTRLPPSSDGSL